LIKIIEVDEWETEDGPEYENERYGSNSDHPNGAQLPG
jgi:hypothetical protein